MPSRVKALLTLPLLFAAGVRAHVDEEIGLSDEQLRYVRVTLSGVHVPQVAVDVLANDVDEVGLLIARGRGPRPAGAHVYLRPHGSDGGDADTQIAHEAELARSMESFAATVINVGALAGASLDPLAGGRRMSWIRPVSLSHRGSLRPVLRMGLTGSAPEQFSATCADRKNSHVVYSHSPNETLCTENLSALRRFVPCGDEAGGLAGIDPVALAKRRYVEVAVWFSRGGSKPAKTGGLRAIPGLTTPTDASMHAVQAVLEVRWREDWDSSSLKRSLDSDTQPTLANAFASCAGATRRVLVEPRQQLATTDAAASGAPAQPLDLHVRREYAPRGPERLGGLFDLEVGPAGRSGADFEYVERVPHFAAPLLSKAERQLFAVSGPPSDARLAEVRRGLADGADPDFSGGVGLTIRSFLDDSDVAEATGGHLRGAAALQGVTVTLAQNSAEQTVIRVRGQLKHGEVMRLTFPVAKGHVHMRQFGPACEKGFDLATGVLSWTAGGSGARQRALASASSSPGSSASCDGDSYLMFTPAPLLLAPMPDFSMPFNIIAFSSTAMTIMFGSVFELGIVGGRDVAKASAEREKAPMRKRLMIAIAVGLAMYTILEWAQVNK